MEKGEERPGERNIFLYDSNVLCDSNIKDLTFSKNAIYNMRTLSS